LHPRPLDPILAAGRVLIAGFWNVGKAGKINGV